MYFFLQLLSLYQSVLEDGSSHVLELGNALLRIEQDKDITMCIYIHCLTWVSAVFSIRYRCTWVRCLTLLTLVIPDGLAFRTTSNAEPRSKAKPHKVHWKRVKGLLAAVIFYINISSHLLVIQFANQHSAKFLFKKLP